MAYSGVSIIKDVNEKPVPQYWNKELSKFEVISSKGGRLRVELVNKDGTSIYNQELVNQISLKLDELIGVVNNIGL